MTPLDAPLQMLPPEQVQAHLAHIQAFIDTTDQPNTVGADGKTCLQWAFTFCHEPDGEDRDLSLLKRGANPNLPTAWANFVVFMMVAKRKELLEQMIDAAK